MILRMVHVIPDWRVAFTVRCVTDHLLLSRPDANVVRQIVPPSVSVELLGNEGDGLFHLYHDVTPLEVSACK